MKKNTKMKSINKFSVALTLAFVFFMTNINVFAQVNTTGGVSLVQGDQSPHASAMLDIISTNKGVLLPRLTTAQRLAITPLTQGLLVYDLTEYSFYYVDQDTTCWRVLENHKANGSTGCDESSGKVPVGGIISYYGLITNFPSGLGQLGTQYEGWAICDGQPGTPDLRGRFVVGVGTNQTPHADEEENTNYAMGTGANDGLNKYTLQPTQTGVPAHNHTLTAPISSGTTLQYQGFTVADGSHTHNIDVRTNGTQVGVQNAGFRRGPIESGTVKTGTTGSEHQHAIDINGPVTITGSVSGATDASTAIPASAAHVNRPPYYALYYIIRLK